MREVVGFSQSASALPNAERGLGSSARNVRGGNLSRAGVRIRAPTLQKTRGVAEVEKSLRPI